MSRVLKDLRVEVTGREKAVRNDLIRIDELVVGESSIFRDTIKEHIFKAEFGITAHCCDADIGDMKRNVYRELQDYIYGDLRTLINELERNLFERDLGKMKEVLREIYKLIYD